MQNSNKRSVLLGLIGSHIGASKSPLLHETEAAHQGLHLVYRLVDFERLGLAIPDLGELLRWAENFGFDGFNVTHPYKTAIIPLLHEMSVEAIAIGAANTIVLKDGKRIGHNTDWFGFAEGVRRGLPGAALEVIAQAGAGGAGAATAYAVLTLGCKQLSIFDINRQRARDLAELLGRQFPDRRIVAAPTIDEAMQRADGVVLATPVGMVGLPGMPFDPALLRAHMWVSDVIYAPLETEMLAQARKLGCRTMNGGAMLSFQAARAFRLFTGMEADAERMLATFLNASGSVTPSTVDCEGAGESF
jgi:shikimate dehydrogenase